MSEETSSTVGRRGLILGASAGALLTTGVAAQAGAAAATPGPGGSSLDSQAPADVDSPAGSPVASTLGSAPVSGFNYHHLAWADFHGESAQRAWGGYGVYSTGTLLHGTIDLPSGARIRDIEWYVYNNSGSPVTGYGRLWVAGQGPLSGPVLDASIPAGAAVSRTRVVVPAATFGPHPLGCKLDLALYSANNTVQINGARVGFEVANGRTGLMSTPYRAYDSRVTGGKFASGETRLITLPPTIVLPGVTGALLNITAHSAVAGGWLKVYPGHGAAPGASALNYAPGQSLANAMIVGVSSARQIKIYASKAVHVIVDISGTIA